MQLSHRCMTGSAVFDEPNLVSSAGLVPVLVLAESAGLRMLAEQHLTVPTDKGVGGASGRHARRLWRRHGGGGGLDR